MGAAGGTPGQIDIRRPDAIWDDMRVRRACRLNAIGGAVEAKGLQ